MSPRKMKELPGWEEAKIEAAYRRRRDGSEYQDSIGGYLQIIGAIVMPPSVDHVSADLLKALVIGLQRHDWVKRDREELARQEAEKVVDFSEARHRLEMRRISQRHLAGDWSRTWNHHGNARSGEINGEVPGL